MLSIVIILVCVSLDVSYQELGRPIFLEGILGLTRSHVGNSKNTLKAILRKMGRLYYMIVFSVLIKVMILVFTFLS
jgi:hypothetical protein